MVQAILVAAACAGLYYTGHAAVKGVKKAGHETVCVVKHGHRCPKTK